MNNEPNVDSINQEAFSRALEERNERDSLLILIVEDQKFSRLMLQNFLAKQYEVVTACDGKEALIEYIKHAPDIVFLDIELPGVEGHKVLSLVKRLDKEAYIVMATASDSAGDVEKAVQNGARGFIVKPFTKDKIYDFIDKFISEKQRQQLKK